MVFPTTAQAGSPHVGFDLAHRRQLESSRACAIGAGWRHGTTETQH
jgi:hypothetical protein